MKGIRVTIILITLTLLASIPVFAGEMTATANVTYYCDDSFYVTIPETIVVNETNTIEVCELNISPEKTLYVDLETNDNGGVTIHNEYQDAETLDVMFVRSTGEDVTTGCPNIATFPYGAPEKTATFWTYVPSYTGKLAGRYTGVATFRIHCE